MNLDDEAKLCELVSAYPSLYNSSHDEYKNTILKENLWKEISLSMGEGKSVELCKKRWRTIRDHFKRLNRDGKLGTESATVKPVNWSLLKYLSFLKHVPEERSTQSNISQLEQDEELSGNVILDVQGANDSCTPSPSLPPHSLGSDTSSRISKKRKLVRVSKILVENKEAKAKLLETLNESSQNMDDIDAFYKSIAISVKRLPPLLKAEAKMQHLQILQNLELKYMLSQQPYNYSETIPAPMLDSGFNHRNNPKRNFQQFEPTANVRYLHHTAPPLTNMSSSSFENLNSTTSTYKQ